MCNNHFAEMAVSSIYFLITAEKWKNLLMEIIFVSWVYTVIKGSQTHVIREHRETHPLAHCTTRHHWLFHLQSYCRRHSCGREVDWGQTWQGWKKSMHEPSFGKLHHLGRGCIHEQYLGNDSISWEKEMETQEHHMFSEELFTVEALLT